MSDTQRIAENLKTVQSALPESVLLVAVSKTHPAEAIEAAYACGHRHFGENKVQEMVDKAAELPKDICWHLIGHLQRNKVKYIIDFVHLIHGVDSEKLLAEINKRAEQAERRVDILLQVHIAEEESKFGFGIEELTNWLTAEVVSKYPAVRIRGLMGMATFTDDEGQIKTEFGRLHDCFQALKKGLFSEDIHFDTLSMGMSGDYPNAVECGSTLVRVGSKIFGAREYK